MMSGHRLHHFLLCVHDLACHKVKKKMPRAKNTVHAPHLVHSDKIRDILCKECFKFECLYNPQNEDVHNIDVTVPIWEKILTEVKKVVPDAKGLITNIFISLCHVITSFCTINSLKI